jgi:hypothetical protein
MEDTVMSGEAEAMRNPRRKPRSKKIIEIQDLEVENDIRGIEADKEESSISVENMSNNADLY